MVVIHKSERALGLYLDGRLAATYRVALGSNPEGHKQREGDGRTPEGSYYICTRNPRSRFYLFLGLSYPNTRDAQAGLRAGYIAQEQHDAIVQAERSRQRPPWDTPLGGEIGLHGQGSSYDWTLGCIALEDAEVRELWEVLKVGDPVLIEP